MARAQAELLREEFAPYVSPALLEQLCSDDRKHVDAAFDAITNAVVVVPDEVCPFVCGCGLRGGLARGVLL